MADKDQKQGAPIRSGATEQPSSSSATTRDAYAEKLSSNPKFKEVKKSGQAFVIVGAKPQGK